jgi:hypothetical protein
MHVDWSTLNAVLNGLDAVLKTALFLVTAVGVTRWGKSKQAEATKSEISIVQGAVHNAVYAVEQLSKKSGVKGDVKLEQAAAIALNLLPANIKMKVADSELLQRIESAVSMMNGAFDAFGALQSVPAAGEDAKESATAETRTANVPGNGDLDVAAFQQAARVPVDPPQAAPACPQAGETAQSGVVGGSPANGGAEGAKGVR